jgi:hypothetical protein
MDARTGRSVTGPRTGWLEIDEPGWLTPLGELAFSPHLNLARLVAAIFRPGATRPGFGVSPMSDEWLERYAADSGKHVDQI